MRNTLLSQCFDDHEDGEEEGWAGRWLGLTGVGDALLLGIGCLAWTVAVIVIALLFWH